MTSSFNESDLHALIANSEIPHIERDVKIVQSLDIPGTLPSVILEEAYLINNAVSLNEVLNSPAPFDDEPTRSEISNSMLQEMLDSCI